MSKQKIVRYAIWFTFTALIYGRFIRNPLIHSALLYHDYFPLFFSFWLFGIAFPLLVAAYSFALINKDIYRLHPLKLGLSTLVAVGIYTVMLHISLWLVFSVRWIPFAKDITVQGAVISWLTSGISHAIIVGVCAFLFWVILRFSSNAPIIRTFPCKKFIFALVMLASAILKIAEEISMAITHPSPFIGQLAKRFSRHQSAIMLSLDVAIVAAIFMVAIYVDIRIRKSATLTAPEN